MKKETIIIVVLLVALLLCICAITGVGGYIWYTNSRIPTITPTVSITNTTSPTIEPTSVATNTPVATVNPTSIVAPKLPSVEKSFIENFNNNDNDWPNKDFSLSLSSGKRTIAGGVYTVSTTAKESVYNYFYPDADIATNFETSVDGKLVSTDSDASFGLVMKIDEDTDALYLFSIAPESQDYKFLYFDGTDSTRLINWTVDNSIKKTGVNNIKVVCLNNTYYFYINGTLVNSIKNSGITSGYIGLATELFEENVSSTVEFDNFRINYFK